MSTNCNILFNDKPAYKIKARKISNRFMSGAATMYDCEGDRIWVPNSLCKYDEREETLVIVDWFYNKLVREGKL